MFALGDKVVRKNINWGKVEQHINESLTTKVHPGGVYVVTGYLMAHDGPCILINDEAPHTCDCCEGESGWDPDGFEKIVPADPAFIVMLNRCKPQVTEDA